MNTTDALHIERVAEALWQFDSEHVFGLVKPWDGIPVYSKNMYRGMAKFAVAAFLKPVERPQLAQTLSNKAPQTVGLPDFTL